MASGSFDKTARVWETTTGKEIARMTHDNIVSLCAFSPNGKYVVSGSHDSTARVWEVVTGKEVARMTHQGAVFLCAFSPDSKYVVSGSRDKTARVWEVTTGKEMICMTHDISVESVAFSPDGRYIASGCEDETVCVWMWELKDVISNMWVSLPRNLTRNEWKQYIGDVLPYEAVCPSLPIEPERSLDLNRRLEEALSRLAK